MEVKSIAREAGSRTKMAVWSNDENVDPIGACVGPKGQRVAAIVEELRGEKIDIIKWSEDPAQFIAAALAPADVVDVWMADEGKACRCVVPDDQLSLAIGKEGQNARLAARLTGYKIDIKPESYQEGDEAETAPEMPEDAAETAPVEEEYQKINQKGGLTDAESEKDPPAAVCGLPGNERPEVPAAGGEVPGGDGLPGLRGKEARPRRLCVPRCGVPAAGPEVPGPGAGL